MYKYESKLKIYSMPTGPRQSDSGVIIAEPEVVNFLRSSEIDSKPGGIDFLNWFLGSLNFYKFGLCIVFLTLKKMVDLWYIFCEKPDPMLIGMEIEFHFCMFM